MKQLILLCGLFILGSCADSTNLVEENETEIFNLDKSDFVNQTGYVQLILDNATAQEWKENYIKVTTENSGNEFLNQYRLNAVSNMVTRSDFLSTIQESEAAFLMQMYNDFKTNGGLEIKHLMLNTLSKYYPAEKITSLRTTAYNDGLQYKETFERKLAEYTNRTIEQEGEKWRDMTVKSYQEKVDDANNFLHYFSPSH